MNAAGFASAVVHSVIGEGRVSGALGQNYTSVQDRAIAVARSVLRTDGLEQAPTLDGARILAAEYLRELGIKR